MAKQKIYTPEEINLYLRIASDDLKYQTGQHATISGTTCKNADGTEDVRTKDARKINGLNWVRNPYKKSLRFGQK